MTGYGEVRAIVGDRAFVCRVKSLNHRFLDIKLKLPRNDWLSLDMAIRKRLAESLKRGAVELSLNYDGTRPSDESLVNTELARTYWKELIKLAQDLGLQASAADTFHGNALGLLLRLPGVVGAVDSSPPAQGPAFEADLLAKLVEPAIKALRAARRSEGVKLGEHILSMIRQMEVRVEKIKELEGPEKERARQTIIERAQETLKILNAAAPAHGSTEDFAARLREEAVFWIERRDFEEERMRLSMHLESFRELVAAPTEAPGRKLEFLQQEILREINTLGTKAQSPSVTEQTIELKTMLERVREQLANVE